VHAHATAARHAHCNAHCSTDEVFALQQQQQQLKKLLAQDRCCATRRDAACVLALAATADGKPVLPCLLNKRAAACRMQKRSSALTSYRLFYTTAAGSSRASTDCCVARSALQSFAETKRCGCYCCLQRCTVKTCYIFVFGGSLTF
jgi:hypothetical protein